MMRTDGVFQGMPWEKAQQFQLVVFSSFLLPL